MSKMISSVEFQFCLFCVLRILDMYLFDVFVLYFLCNKLLFLFMHLTSLCLRLRLHGLHDLQVYFLAEKLKIVHLFTF